MTTARKKINLEELIQRATSGRKFNRHELFRPVDQELHTRLKGLAMA
jgi:hypothetical protein